MTNSKLAKALGEVYQDSWQLAELLELIENGESEEVHETLDCMRLMLLPELLANLERHAEAEDSINRLRKVFTDIDNATAAVCEFGKE